MQAAHVFEPAFFSNQELSFLMEHLEKPSIAALHRDVPKGVNPTAIKSLLDRLYSLAELEKHEGVRWAGYEAVRGSIVRFMEWTERCRNIHKRGGPRFAGQFAWDSTGQPHKYAVGADSAEAVRTEILADGSRQAFAVTLTDAVAEQAGYLELMPWVDSREGAVKQFKDKLVVDDSRKRGTITCPICGEVETFDTKVRSSFNVARARMAKHLKQATVEVARHRMLYTTTAGH